MWKIVIKVLLVIIRFLGVGIQNYRPDPAAHVPRACGVIRRRPYHSIRQATSFDMDVPHHPMWRVVKGVFL